MIKLKNKLLLDLSKRNFYKIKEIPVNILHAITTNKILSYSIRTELSNRLYNNKNSICRIRNRCLFSGRGRGVVTTYKLSRIKFKELNATGLISGVQKSSW